MTADFGPCAPWPVRWLCDVSTQSPTATGIAVSSATEILWALSGRRFGTCQVTLRPCAEDCYSGQYWSSYGAPWPSSVFPSRGWSWFNTLCGSCSGTCSCTEISEVLLPAPVSSIVSVKVDGVAMVTGGAAYRVDDNRRLVRTDGLRWPRCNDLSRDDTQPGTWSVTALYGEDVPDMAQLAVGEMACEILKAMGGEDCRLPTGITQLVREGVTISYPDIGSLWKQGRTGLYLVDAFLTTENPNGLHRRSRTYRVDGPTPRRVGT